MKKEKCYKVGKRIFSILIAWNSRETRVKRTIALSMRAIRVTTIHPVKNVNEIRWPRSIIEFSLRILPTKRRTTPSFELLNGPSFACELHYRINYHFLRFFVTRSRFPRCNNQYFTSIDFTTFNNRRLIDVRRRERSHTRFPSPGICYRKNTEPLARDTAASNARENRSKERKRLFPANPYVIRLHPPLVS